MHDIRSGRAGVSAIDEAALLTALKAGHEWAYEATVRIFGPRLLAAARRLTPDETTARGAVRQACLNVFEALEGPGAPGAVWMRLHHALLRVAGERVRPRSAPGTPEGPIEALLPRFDGDGRHAQPVTNSSLLPDAASPGAVTRAAVQACVARLPEWHRTLLLLCDAEGFSTREVADALATTPVTVKLGLHRARQALATLLCQQFAQQTAQPDAGTSLRTSQPRGQ